MRHRRVITGTVATEYCNMSLHDLTEHKKMTRNNIGTQTHIYTKLTHDRILPNFGRIKMQKGQTSFLVQQTCSILCLCCVFYF